MKMDMSRYFSNDLVTVGQLRSPDLPPPPYYNDDATSAETFQSCSLRLYLKIEGNVDRVDMFEIEVVENIPLTKVFIINVISISIYITTLQPYSSMHSHILKNLFTFI